MTLTAGEQLVVELDSLDANWITNHLGHFRLLVSDDQRLAAQVLRLANVQSLAASAPLKLAAMLLKQGEMDQPQNLLAGFTSPQFPADHVLQPLLETVMYRQLGQLLQVEAASVRLRESLRDQLVPPLDADLLETLTTVGGMTRTSAIDTLTTLAIEHKLRRQTESLQSLSDTYGVMNDMAQLAWLGRIDEYQTHRKRLLEIVRDTQDPVKAERIAKACSLQPGTTEEQVVALELARRAISVGGSQNDLPWFQLALGMAAYRAGRHTEAVTALTAAWDGQGDQGSLGGAAAFYHAMSLQQLGRTEEARARATAATARIAPLPSDVEDGLSADLDQLIMWLAYKEAKTLIGFEETAENPAPPAFPGNVPND